jgi:molybdenum cofactor synthesis domain-containing protein
VELLSVGNELLLGNTVNTNATWIAAQSTSVGAEVKRITTIGDNLDEISSAVRESLRRKPNYLITTGGIGPTFDDMTLKGVARALGRGTRLDRKAVALIRAHYARRFKGKPINLSGARLKMARIPKGATALPNPVGTAPGVLLAAGRTQIFCIPGVPSEAKSIFQESILPKIRADATGRTFIEHWLKLSGIMESSLAPIIDRVMGHNAGVYIKSHPRGIENNRPHLELHFSTFTSAKTRGDRTLRIAIKEMTKELKQRDVKVQALS